MHKDKLLQIGSGDTPRPLTPEVNHDSLLNRKIALIIWHPEDEKEVRIVHGRITRTSGEWAAENPEKGWRIPLDKPFLQRIRLVTKEDGPAFGDAEFGLSLSMASIPGNDTSGYQKTGLQLK